jgi:hypothetical protein
MKYLNSYCQGKLLAGGNVIFCMDRESAKNIAKYVPTVFDTIDGLKCDNCNTDILISKAKLEISDSKCTFLCPKCAAILLSDEEYNRQASFVDIEDKENNTLGKLMEEVFRKKDE